MARRDWSCALKHRVLGGCGSRDVAGRPTSRSVGVSGGAARRFSLTTEQLARVSQRLNPRRAIERHLRCRLRLRNRRKGSEWTSGRYRRRSIRAVCIAVRGRGRCWLRPRPGTGLGADSPQADTTPSAASAAPPASTPRLLMGRFVSRLMTGAALSTATSCHQKDAATKAGETLNGVITASFVIPGVSLVATPAAACRRDTGSRPGGASAR